MTRERWDGLHVRLDDGHLRTKRRKKTVNHGTWKRYHLSLVHPEETLHVHIGPVRQCEDGRTAFLLSLDSQIHATAQWVEWNRGVRLWSVTAAANADVRLWVDCRLGVKMDVGHFPPDLVLQPEVVDGDLQILSFDVERIGAFDGPLVRELGQAMQGLVREKIEEKRPQLIAKVNRQLAKHQEDLRLSAKSKLQSSLSRWLPGPAPSP
jgi:hypothetical protein